ncbi:MAG: 6-carboxytetrahydropterin synthase [Planctomycetota bacterium]
MYEATIEKTFSAAHALRLPDGSLEPLHGHDWLVKATVASEGLDAMDTVMDFHDLEQLVESRIGPWRNQNLNAVAPFSGGAGGEDHAHGLAINPSAERVAEQIAWTVSGGLPEHVWLKEISVGEAPGCVARYRP